ncbi:hypothetical protein [Arthrobacter mobilis]|uniref:Uncharacterized protein n=1 Tax=Arthrobacter mobilis TaxID=2724944 RepID=A0A7X6HBV4_9MICC|nr:hypothetical protein [Arthrobacter mobilis]NKX53031.1 hypothetical protein [Arthrobacter mobilis]
MDAMPDRATLLELRRLGLWLEEIARKYGVEESVIRAALMAQPGQDA